MLVKIDKNRYLNADYCVAVALVEDPKELHMPFAVVANMIDASAHILFKGDNKKELEQVLDRFIKAANDKGK